MISVPNARAMSLRALQTFDGITSATAHAERGAEQRVGDAGVAAGRVDQDLVAGEAPVREGVLHHPQRGAVLHGAAGVRELELGVDLDRGRLARHAREAHERRVADGLDDRGAAGANRIRRPLSGRAPAVRPRRPRGGSRRARRGRRRAARGRPGSRTIARGARRLDVDRARGRPRSKPAAARVEARDLVRERRTAHRGRAARAMRACPASPISGRRICRTKRGAHAQRRPRSRGRC